MSIENPSERLERTEAYLKQRLSGYKSTMPVKGCDAVTLLEIYWEWMDYLVKESLKKRSNLLKKWQKFLLERNTDAVADLLIGFFEAKRRYGRDIERGEDKRDWFTLCSNYCKKNGWYEDENLLHSLFSSYSGAERRIYRKVEWGKMLADTSKSILQTMALTKSEMIKKEEEKKKKAEEKAMKELEKQRRKAEREKRKEEKEIQKAKEESIDEVPVTRDEWAENHYGWDDENIMNDDGDVVLNPKYEHVPSENSEILWDERDEVEGVISTKNEVLKWEKKKRTESSEKKEKNSNQKKEPEQLYFNFDD